MSHKAASEHFLLPNWAQIHRKKTNQFIWYPLIALNTFNLSLSHRLVCHAVKVRSVNSFNLTLRCFWSCLVYIIVAHHTVALLNVGENGAIRCRKISGISYELWSVSKHSFTQLPLWAYQVKKKWREIHFCMHISVVAFDTHWVLCIAQCAKKLHSPLYLFTFFFVGFKSINWNNMRNESRNSKDKNTHASFNVIFNAPYWPLFDFNLISTLFDVAANTF